MLSYLHLERPLRYADLATGWTNKNLGFEPRKKQEIFLFSEISRRPLQLSIQKVLCKAVGLTTHHRFEGLVLN
jgi:hypothetical protein